ncbi:MAG: hypothetical protein Q8Q12_06925 [bacterium]|nr:hypothetical protein [bacterium]
MPLRLFDFTHLGCILTSWIAYATRLPRLRSIGNHEYPYISSGFRRGNHQTLLQVALKKDSGLALYG